MMRCIIIDDEDLVRELLADSITKIPYLELVAKFRNPLEALEIMQAKKIDLIFLDIQMPQLGGLVFLKSLQQPPLVIMITAHEKYALQGFDLNVVDFVLKPFSMERLVQACNKANELHLARTAPDDHRKPPEFFFVKVEYEMVRITIDAITHIEGFKDYLKIHLRDIPRPVITRMSMKLIGEMLPAEMFLRTHKSFLVAANWITAIKRDFVCVGKTEIPVSPHFKENVTQKFK